MGTFLKNAILADYDPPRAMMGGLRVENGVIAVVGRDAAAARGDEIIDCGGAVVLPGLVNGHTHLYSALAAGMPAPRKTPANFHEILQYVWWRLDRALDAESIEASGVVGALDALRHGTTTLIDHHASPNCIEGSLDMLGEGIGRVGLRAVLCYETTDRNGVDGAKAGLAENRRYAERCSGARDGLRGSLIGGHAAFTLGDKTLDSLSELTGETGLGIHIHVAEDPCDDALSRGEYGAGALERLVRCGVVRADAVLAHCIHLNDESLSLIGKAGATVAHNPRSNMNNGVGYARIEAMRAPVMLGTDGIGSDMFAESRFAVFKGADAGSSTGPARVLEMLASSARRASKSLGVTVGRLAPGAAGDVVVTDYVPATPLDSDNLCGHFIYALDGAAVRDVMVGGRWLMRGGVVRSVDVPSERHQARAAASALWRRMAALA